MSEPCPPPLDRNSVAEHMAACPRCRGNLRRAAARGATWQRKHEGEVREREEAIYAERRVRAAAWTPDRIRSIMADTSPPTDNPP